MNINWFPGHMKKAREEIAENLKLVDVLIELVDARAPYASSNPLLVTEKPNVLVLTKADLANERSVAAFLEAHPEAVVVDGKTGDGVRKLLKQLDVVAEKVNERLKSRGRKPRAVRAMVVGVPNVGKSTLINRIAGRSVTKTGDRPGVTKGKQWIRIAKGVELCDTPGILWPKFEDQRVGIKLAAIGSIRDEILNEEELAIELANMLPMGAIGAAYGETASEIQSPEDKGSALSRDAEVEDAAKQENPDFAREEDLKQSNPDLPDEEEAAKRRIGYEVLETVGRRRGALLKGGEVDTLKAARILIDDFRSGKLGRISLE